MPRPKESDGHWLVRPRTIRILWIVFSGVLAATVLADLFIVNHPVFGIDGLMGFYAVYGFLSCVALIALARGFGFFVKRPDDYYDD